MGLLTVDPDMRPSAAEALTYPWFSELNDGIEQALNDNKSAVHSQVQSLSIGEEVKDDEKTLKKGPMKVRLLNESNMG
jgi:serine/threonine protein kinase